MMITRSRLTKLKSFHPMLNLIIFIFSLFWQSIPTVALWPVVRSSQYAPPPASGYLNSQSELSARRSPHVGDTGHYTPSIYQVWRLYTFPFWGYGWSSVTALIDLVTLTFDLSTSTWGHGLPCYSAFPNLHPRAFCVAKDRDWRPSRGPPGSALLLCV